MLTDSHCHLKDSRYGKSPREVVEDSRKHGVSLFINIATSLEDSLASSEIASDISEVYSTAGVYPHNDLGSDTTLLISELEKIIDANNKIVGVGECGIDVSGYNPSRGLEEQKKLFVSQIELSLKKDKTLVIHNRNADETVLSILSEYADKV